MAKKGQFSIRAVLVGWLVYFMGSTVVSVILGICAGIFLIRHLNNPQQKEAVITGLKGICYVVVAFFSIIGGYIAASMAQTDKVKHALWVGILTAIVSTTGLFVGSSHKTALDIVMFLLVIPLAMFGGVMASDATSKRTVDK